MRRAHLVNYALYQIGWFACVLGGASHRPWTGCLIALSLVGVHLTLSIERFIEFLSTPTENLTVPPGENLTDRRGDEPYAVGTS